MRRYGSTEILAPAFVIDNLNGPPPPPELDFQLSLPILAVVDSLTDFGDANTLRYDIFPSVLRRLSSRGILSLVRLYRVR